MRLNPDELMKRGQMSEVANYLAKHLISMLAHASGGKHPSRSWIYRNTDNKLKHTFDERIQAGSDSWGGEPIPIGCLSEDNGGIFEPKADAVRDYITTFDLTEDDVNAVLATIPKR